jgi:hypothetical protein
LLRGFRVVFVGGGRLCCRWLSLLAEGDGRGSGEER